jgi:hypothetical protein
VPEWVEEWKNTWKIIERYMSEQDQVMGDLWATWESTFGLPGYIDNILSHDDLMDRVFANQGTELSYSCAGCWTDFSIRATADDLIITAWQSLGGESAPLDATWRSLMVGKGPKGHLLGSSDRAHAPGSVRKMYSYSATSKLPAQ